MADKEDASTINKNQDIKDNNDEVPPSELDEETVTMLDVLEEEEELEENAFAVLGGSDDQHCTYLRGYMSRQALYSCATCQTIDDDPAGICLACTYSCHEGHQLYELYTKRNFRCDCGNGKFINNTCKLYPKKEPKNGKNNYNDNFKGVYCTCKRPYPDPDNDDDDEMIQCVVCEDWFHGRHLNVKIPDDNEFAEMICFSCMEKLPFLWHYYKNNKETELVKIEKTCEKQVVDVEHVVLPSASSSASSSISSSANSSANCSQSCTNFESDSGIESSCDSAMSTSPVPVKQCKLAGLGLKDKVPEKIVSTFWQDSWRNKLCKCNECMALYSSYNCSFLTDEKDTVHHYEQQGKESGIKVSRYDKGISALSQMDRLHQVEALQSYKNLKDELTDYLKKFAQNKKVVREEDIKEFFNQMNSRKKQKLYIPHHCR